jgi:hypothetical protein
VHARFSGTYTNPRSDIDLRSKRSMDWGTSPQFRPTSIVVFH